MYEVSAVDMKRLETEQLMRSTFGRDGFSKEEAEEAAAEDLQFEEWLRGILDGSPQSLDLDKLWNGLQRVLSAASLNGELDGVIRGELELGALVDKDIGLLSVKRVRLLAELLADADRRAQILDRVKSFDGKRLVAEKIYAWELWERGPVDLVPPVNRLFTFIDSVAQRGNGIVCAVE
jgi:hypothetical protein